MDDREGEGTKRGEMRTRFIINVEGIVARVGYTERVTVKARARRRR